MLKWYKQRSFHLLVASLAFVDSISWTYNIKSLEIKCFTQYSVLSIIADIMFAICIVDYMITTKKKIDFYGSLYTYGPATLTVCMSFLLRTFAIGYAIFFITEPVSLAHSKIYPITIGRETQIFTATDIMALCVFHGIIAVIIQFVGYWCIFIQPEIDSSIPKQLKN